MRSAARTSLAGLLLVVATLLALAGCGARPIATAPETRGPGPGDAAAPTDASTLAGVRSTAEPAGAHLGRRREPYRVLFVGNSLTASNDLPRLVAALSVVAGDDPPMQTAVIAYGGFALEDHLFQGDAPRAIAQGGWDVVTLQQGPSTLPESRVNLIEYTGRFDTLIRAAGARTALYGVWPDASRLFALDDGIESYRQAAESVNGMLFPAGLAWKAAWRRDPSLPLYSGDAFHPSALGTYLAALVIYAEIRDKSPVGLPSEISIPNFHYVVDPDDARICQLAAEEVTFTRRRPGKPWGNRHPHADAPWVEDAPGRSVPVPEDLRSSAAARRRPTRAGAPG